MTIAITAPEKFRYQDFASVRLALLFLSDPTFRLFPEPADGEDAELNLGEGSTIRVIEVQMKDEVGSFGLAKLATLLAHFPSHSAEKCLLERLRADPSRLMIFFASGRAEDALQSLIVPVDWIGEPHPVLELKRFDAEAFLKHLRSQWDKKTTLSSERRKRCVALADEITPTVMRDIARRVIVFDRQDIATIEESCSSVIRRRWFAPLSEVQPVQFRLLEAVRKAKITQRDAAVEFRTILEEYHSRGLRVGSYALRGDEETWRAELTARSVLLLSGIPRCGKTMAGRRIANMLRGDGFAIEERTTVAEAERYLLEPGPEDRCLLLDDPLGSLEPVERPYDTLSATGRLIGRLPTHRKLIVTQRLDILIHATGGPGLENCNLSQHAWHDLGRLDPEFLVAVWNLLAREAMVPDWMAAKVRDRLRACPDPLEPGCLQHLAATWRELPSPATETDLWRHARREARDLGRALSNNGDMRELLLALAIATTRDSTIKKEELAFILAAGDDLPGRGSGLGGGIVIGGGGMPPPRFPEYPVPPRLSQSHEAALSSLLERAFIVDTQGDFGFTHPYYRAAAESLLSNPNYIEFNRILLLLRRALFSLSAHNSTAAAKNLAEFFSRDGLAEGPRCALVKLALEGFESIFPATRDACIPFVTENLRMIASEVREQYDRRVMSAIGYRNEMFWFMGQAWIPSDEVGAEHYVHGWEHRENSEAAVDITRLGNPAIAERFTPERASYLLDLLLRRPEAVTAVSEKRLLSFDESAIRADAAEVWLMRNRDNDEEVLELIFGDRHPAVTRGACRGLVTSWSTIGPVRRKAITKKLDEVLTNPTVAILMIHELIVYDRVEHTGSNPPWELWAVVFPGVLQALPPLAGFDEARLFNVMEVALSKKLPAEAILTICDAWLGWLERALQEYLPSEFALGVTEIVLSVTVGKPELRRTFSQIILKQTDTGALIAFLRDYISHWNELDVDERATILRLLSDDRPDVLWLRATALACRNVPREIEEAILGKGGLLSFSPGDLIDQIPFNLLEACVKTYRGNPGILSYIGPHHASAVWKEVVWELARHPEHPLWGSAVEEILSVGSSNTDRSAKIFSAMPKAANRLFKLLLSHNVRTNAGWNSAAWHAVLTNAPDKATLDSWFDEMAAAAPAILDGLYDIRLWMKDQPWVDHLLNRLGADVALNDLAYVLEKDLGQDTGIRSKAVQLIDACYHDRPAKLLHTHDRVAKVLRDVGLESDALVKLVLVARERSLEEMTQIRKMFEPVSEQLKGWQSKFVTG